MIDESQCLPNKSLSLNVRKNIKLGCFFANLKLNPFHTSFNVTSCSC